jgi:hypothetical protein
MQPQPEPPSSPRLRIGSDGQTADLQPDAGGAVVAFDSDRAGRSRAWLPATGLGCQPIVPGPSGAIGPWHVSRYSRDQAELVAAATDAAGEVLLHARQIVTVDDWGLHLALVVEHRTFLPQPARWGWCVTVRASRSSTLEVPPGSWGSGGETARDVSPFRWPRRSLLRHADGDQLEILAHSPLARTHVRRRADCIELRLLSPLVLARGETARAECRLRARLGDA